MDAKNICYFGETDARNKRVKFGIKADDRSRHMYVIGKTGMGKSTLLENMAIQDIQNGDGVAFIDPHGKTAELLLSYVPEERIKDVLYFAPFDLDYPVSFNVMEDVGPDQRHLVVSGLMSAFKKIWVDAWSARMEYILNNILLALLEYPGSTILGVNRMLADKDYRKKVVDNVKDVSVKAFWVDEFAKYGERYMQEAGAAIQNKVGQFISNPLIRNIIGQPASTFNLREIMDRRKIVIVNLSKGRVGEQNANLLGSMFVTKLYLSAMSRADLNEASLARMPNFYLYVDEFQSFANESFANILSEARKYKLALGIAHQYIEQMSEEVRAAVFGNVGTMVVFRVGAYDAEVLEKEFAPRFTAEDIVNLGFAQIYLKLMIDGVTSPPFSATTLPPFDRPPASFRDDIVDWSRRAYARPRADVEAEIRTWSEVDRVPEPPPKRAANRDRQPREEAPVASVAPVRREELPRPGKPAPERKFVPRDIPPPPPPEPESGFVSLTDLAAGKAPVTPAVMPRREEPKPSPRPTEARAAVRRDDRRPPMPEKPSAVGTETHRGGLRDALAAALAATKQEERAAVPPPPVPKVAPPPIVQVAPPAPRTSPPVVPSRSSDTTLPPPVRPTPQTSEVTADDVRAILHVPPPEQ